MINDTPTDPVIVKVTHVVGLVIIGATQTGVVKMFPRKRRKEKNNRNATSQ